MHAEPICKEGKRSTSANCTPNFKMLTPAINTSNPPEVEGVSCCWAKPSPCTISQSGQREETGRDPIPARRRTYFLRSTKMFSIVFVFRQLPSTLSLDGSTCPVWAFTHGRLIRDRNEIWGGSDG